MLILASASPRRRDLLAQAGFVFEVQAASIDERPRLGEDAIGLSTRLARQKAEAVFASRRASAPPGPSPIVLGADTVVTCEGRLFEKPKDREDAAGMLRALSGKTHQVVTGVAVIGFQGDSVAARVAAEVTHVTFLTLAEGEIVRYVACGEPMDKAGAYGIQGYAARWIPRINGCYFNVVGLPLALVSTMLDGIGRRI